MDGRGGGDLNHIPILQVSQKKRHSATALFQLEPFGAEAGSNYCDDNACHTTAFGAICEVGGYAGLLPEKHQQDDPNNDKHASQDAHVDLVLLRRKQTLRDRCALPEPPLKNIWFDEVQGSERDQNDAPDCH